MQTIGILLVSHFLLHLQIKNLHLLRGFYSKNPSLIPLSHLNFEYRKLSTEIFRGTFPGISWHLSMLSHFNLQSLNTCNRSQNHKNSPPLTLLLYRRFDKSYMSLPSSNPHTHQMVSEIEFLEMSSVERENPPVTLRTLRQSWLYSSFVMFDTA